MSDDFDRDDELRARLRGLDPAASLSPADPSRVARLLEDTMSNDLMNETRETGTHHRGRLTWLVAAAAVVLIAAVGAFGIVHHDAQDPVPSAGGAETPSVTELSGPTGGVNARCMVPTAELLSSATLAFDGTVQKIADGMVTLVPSQFFAGEPTDVVTVAAPTKELQALIGAVKFEDNGRYLVSATDGHVKVCGFTGPYSPQLASLYADAFTG